MNLVIEYWYLIVAFLVVIALGAIYAVKLFRTPTVEQLDKVKAWLLWAVVEAERDLGSGTGKLKLSMVYGIFVEKFTWIAKILPFVVFSGLVDSALETMREILQNNKSVADIIKKETDL